ncbi:hypothetical protein CGLO_05261 [Colletotrichum gloeosporioides Cg-14]|uniref:Uncharacterized protein n=1 Tax=Colletotrichum gloeosporioides (strain Cg-14) TaxID=1237896 RepID=T0KH82_COLGC|nr:hypothetical protein CGLO_05261 [Colletotrichum gloeosporioides Cg-14]
MKLSSSLASLAVDAPTLHTFQLAAIPMGAFQGWFASGEVKNLCYQYGDQKWEFQITNLNQGAGFDLNDDSCANGLAREIIGCESGGQSDNAGWRFR